MNWVGIASIIVAFQYAAAFLIGAIIGVDYVIPFSKILEGFAFAAVFSILGFALIRVIYFAIIREPQPLKRFVEDLLRSGFVPPALALAAAQWAVLSWLKVLMPHAVGFWADPPLADLDALIFAGDAWRLTHMIPIGRPIDTVYGLWSVVVSISFMVLAFAPESAKRGQAMVAYFLVIGFSALSQYLLPSAGPIFFQAAGHGDRFADLPLLPTTERTADYLWSSYISMASKVGTGISAMPSVHIGISAWLALCVSTYFPRLKIAGWAYFSVILFGSVYLGWHYVVDGIAGLAIAIAAWRIAPRLLNIRAARVRSATASPAAG